MSLQNLMELQVQKAQASLKLFSQVLTTLEKDLRQEALVSFQDLRFWLQQIIVATFFHIHLQVLEGSGLFH